jgi:tetratricopeptide (TPR) repeat protein
MINAVVKTSLRDRLAVYYLKKLQDLEAIYQLGQEHSEYALRLFDQEWPQIKRWWDWTIEHHAEDPQIAQLCKDYSCASDDLLMLRQRQQERLDVLTIGLSVAQQLDDVHAEMIHLYLLGNTYLYSGLSGPARTCADQAVVLARQLNDPLYLMKSLRLLGDTHYLLDEYEQSQSVHQQALALSQELDAKKEMGVILNGLGNVAMSQSQYLLARDYFLQSLELAEVYGQPTDLCIALHNLCAVHARLEMHEQAIDYGERCITLCRAINYQYCLADVMIEVGDLAFRRLDWPAAQHYYQDCVELSEQIQHFSNKACALGRLGRVSGRMGGLAGSLDYLDAALTLSNEIGSRWYAATTLKFMTETLRRKGDLQTASIKLRDGLEIILGIESPLIWSRYLLEAACLWYARGLYEEAALWLGVLRNYVPQLPGDERQLYQDLYPRLTAELGYESFSSMIEQGKQADLKTVILELEGTLSKEHQRL